MATLPEVGPSPTIAGVADCVTWMLDGARSPQARLLGLECERFVIGPDDRLAPYEGRASIRTLLERLIDRHGWRPVTEVGALVGLTRDGATISLEAAGQLEYSAPPLPTVEAIGQTLAAHQAELADVTADLDLRFLWPGYNPADHRLDTPVMPRERYRLMRRNFPGAAGRGSAMLDFTCAVQVSLDFTDAAECLEMVRLGHALTPVLIALFANSPVAGGVDTGCRSWRGRIWPEVDPGRCGAPPIVFDPALSVEQLVDWAWDLPIYFLAERAADGEPRYRMLDQPLTFRQFVGRGLAGRRATLADWMLHLSTCYPDLRPRRQLELRQCDAVPPEGALALPALAQGLFYDPATRRACLARLGDGDRRIDRVALRAAACVAALDADALGGTLRDLARDVITLARAGQASRIASGHTVPDPAAADALDRLEAIVRGEAPPFWATLAAGWARTPSLYALARPA